MIDLNRYENDWLARAGKLSKDSSHAIHMEPDEMREAIHEISDNMRNYAETWQRNAEHLRNAGVYKRVAEFVKPTDCYLDIGCGTGDIIGAVNFPNSLGVDINHYSLAKAEQYLSSMGMPVNSFAHSILKWINGTGTVVIPTDNYAYKVLERGKINLLQDDLRVIKPQRSLDLARRHIKEIGRPDCATFMMPGGSGHTAGEVYSSEQHRHNVLLALIFEAIETASQLLPRGGHYVEALRFIKQPGPTHFVEDFERNFGSLFAIEHTEVFDMPEELTGYNFYLFSADGMKLSSKDAASKKDVAMSVIKARRK